MSVAIVKTSKFLSLVLRHRPELLGLTLDSQGWVCIAELIAAAQSKNHILTLELIHEVVANNNKKRLPYLKMAKIKGGARPLYTASQY